MITLEKKINASIWINLQLREHLLKHGRLYENNLCGSKTVYFLVNLYSGIFFRDVTKLQWFYSTKLTTGQCDVCRRCSDGCKLREKMQKKLYALVESSKQNSWKSKFSCSPIGPTSRNVIPLIGINVPRYVVSKRISLSFINAHTSVSYGITGLSMILYFFTSSFPGMILPCFTLSSYFYLVHLAFTLALTDFSDRSSPVAYGYPCVF